MLQPNALQCTNTVAYVDSGHGPVDQVGFKITQRLQTRQCTEKTGVSTWCGLASGRWCPYTVLKCIPTAHFEIVLETITITNCNYNYNTDMLTVAKFLN